jgi:biotin-(acetyl-CoA carboxylase) ligase
MSDRLGKEAMNRVAKEVGHRPTVRTIDIGKAQPTGKEETKCDGDTQKRGKGRTESKHHPPEGETLQTALAPNPKRPKN